MRADRLRGSAGRDRRLFGTGDLDQFIVVDLGQTRRLDGRTHGPGLFLGLMIRCNACGLRALADLAGEIDEGHDDGDCTADFPDRTDCLPVQSESPTND